jgi:regulator of protease activity HflC (stomatin/prohibitin superfamily)
MLDQVLAVIAILAWVWFVAFLASVMLHAYQAGGWNKALRSFFSFRILVGLLVAVGLSLLSASLVFVEPQEAGVVISLVSPNGYRDQPLRSGLRAIVPLAERVVRYPIYWQTYTMSSDTQEGAKTGNDAISARTSDGQVVYLDSSIIYRIDPNEVIRVHTDLQNRYVEDFIRPLMRGMIRTEVSQFTAEEINSSKRKNLESNLEELIRGALGDKGFILDRFLLRNIAFSTAFSSAIELKQVAEQDRIQREYQAEQIRKLAEGERDRQKIEAAGKASAIEQEAQAKATATVLQARADANALELINQALQSNDSLLLYRYIEKLSPNIRVMLLPNNAPLILPLPDLNEETGATGLPLASPTITGTITNTLSLPSTVMPTPTPTASPATTR